MMRRRLGVAATSAAVALTGFSLVWSLQPRTAGQGSVASRDPTAIDSTNALPATLPSQELSIGNEESRETQPKQSVTGSDRVSDPPQFLLGSSTKAANAASEDGLAIPITAPADSAGRLIKRRLSILHIGDSHTSADFFTGEIRRLLQARYGQGGTGYMTAGHPHIGVRSSTVKIAASSGWSYRSLQRPDASSDKFWLSGYDSVATAPGQTMSFIPDRPISFDLIEIEAVRQPGGGSVDISVNGSLQTHSDLASDHVEPVVIRISPDAMQTALHEISVTTTAPGEVIIASVSVYKDRGLTYNSVGYVGATIGVLNKLSDETLASDLKRINPQIVVLSFGTNEAANEKLDLGDYSKSYEKTVKRIKGSLPSAIIVVVSPPDFNEFSAACSKDKRGPAPCHQMQESWNVAATESIPVRSNKLQCSWATPAKLAQVRDVQHDIATRYGAIYWNWGSIMPGECGAHQWFSMSPPLMSRDHIHFTAEGYKRSAEQFIKTLVPIIEKVRMAADF
jgi:lysophospholipase L1-like esterase